MVRESVPVLIIIVLALGLVACSSGRKVTTTRVIDYPTAPSDDARSWKGHTRDEVIEVWGQPGSRRPDGEGGEIWTYRRAGKLSVSSRTGGESIETSTGTVEMIEGTEQKQTKDVGEFWIDSDGVVYRYWMSAKLFEEGEMDPPGVGPSEDE
jgi:hypothetical protein